MSCYGGRPAMEEHRTMKGIIPTVIIGTPGRMSDHLRKENFDARTVVTLVIDEFDKCLEFGFHDEMAEVIGQFPALKKRVLALGHRCRGNTAVCRSRRGVVSAGCQAGFSFGRNLDPDVCGCRRSFLRRRTSWRPCTGCFVRWATILLWYSCNYRESVERVVGYLKARKFPCDMFHGGME